MVLSHPKDLIGWQHPLSLEQLGLNDFVLESHSFCTYRENCGAREEDSDYGSQSQRMKLIKTKQKGGWGVHTPSVTLDHIALSDVYVFSKIVPLSLSLSWATLGVLILKITKRTEKDHRALPLGGTAIHLFDVKHLKSKFSKKIIFL